MFSETDIIKLLDFFLLKTYLSCFVNASFEVTIGIPNGTNCAPLLVVSFFNSNEEDFMQWLLNINVKNRAHSFHFISRYLQNVDDVHSLNNAKFGYVFYHIYSIELEMHDTTDTHRSASYLDINF